MDFTITSECVTVYFLLACMHLCVCVCALAYHISRGKHPHFETTFTSNHKHHTVLVMFWWFIWHIRALINIVVHIYLKQTCSRNWSTYLMHVIFLNQYSLPFKTMSFILKTNMHLYHTAVQGCKHTHTHDHTHSHCILTKCKNHPSFLASRITWIRSASVHVYPTYDV